MGAWRIVQDQISTTKELSEGNLSFSANAGFSLGTPCAMKEPVSPDLTMHLLRFVLIALTWLTLTQCALPNRWTLRPVEVRKAIVVRPTEGGELPLFGWAGELVSGPLSVTVDLSEQKAYFFKNGERVGWSYVATGTSSHRTPTGSFSILEKQVDKRSGKYGVMLNSSGKVVRSDATQGVHAIPSGGSFLGASMPYWMRLTWSGVGMHAGPIPNPGFPASHGCIRLPQVMAQTLYGETAVGTPVTIVP